MLKGTDYLRVAIAMALMVARVQGGALFTDANRKALKAEWDGDGARIVVGENVPPAFIYYPGEDVVVDVIAPGEASAVEVRPINTLFCKPDRDVRIPTFGSPDVVCPYGTAKDGMLPETRDTDTSCRIVLPVPDSFGTYALILKRAPGVSSVDRHFLGTVARVPRPNAIADPLSAAPVFGEGQGQRFAELARVGVRIVRCEISWDGTSAADYDWRHFDAMAESLRACGMKALFMLGAVGPKAYAMPGLGQPIPGAVTDDWDGSYYHGNADWGCDPARFDDYAEWVEAFCRRYWEGGNGVLWGLENFNEPWEGGGISGYARDCVTYREWHRRMARAAHSVSEDIMICAASFAQDTEDKFYSEGPRRDGTFEADEFIDVYTDHYASLSKSYGPMVAKLHGKISIEDETWRAISEYQLPQLVCQSLASGQRAMACWHPDVLFDAHEPGGPVFPTPLVLSTAVFNSFVGGRDFMRLAFQDHLPWLLQFGDDDDPFGVCVYFGQMLTGGARTPASSPRGRLWGEVDAIPGGRLVLENADGALHFFGPDGNPVFEESDTVELPLDARAFYIRSDRGPSAIRDAFERAEIRGKCAVEILPRDFTETPDGPDLMLRVELVNRLPQPVEGMLGAAAESAVLGVSATIGAPVVLAPGEHAVVEFPIESLAPAGSYPCHFVFECDEGRRAVSEPIRFAVARRLTPEIDGGLEDWDGIPAVVIAGERTGPDADELARKPWSRMTLEINAPQVAAIDAGGADWETLLARLPREALVAELRMAWDKRNIYIAARVRDATPQTDKVRMATRDEDAYFHSAESDSTEPWKSWLEKYDPAGAHSFAEATHVYRRKPNDNAYTGDELQLLFDVIDGYGDLAPATEVPRGFNAVPDTDYEFCVYQCADGAPEAWKLLAPGVPRMHDWPRQPRGRVSTGVAKGVRAAIRQEGDIRFYEVAIPRGALGDLRLRGGTGFRFGFIVNDNHGARVAYGCDKAACKDNGLTAHSYWRASPSCDIEWKLVE